MIVIELFAGVGGFRLGLEGYLKKSTFYSPSDNYSVEIRKPEFFITGYSNQWEPGSKMQYASNIYTKRFGFNGHENRNVEEVNATDLLNSIKNSIPDERQSEALILVGGFPCQDYSVANGLHNSKGILGKKGVLWWHIERLLRELKGLDRQPELLILENVDRLLKSPSNSRGRDFALMLTSLESLGYIVEYRVINAADYGMPQRRKRVFIVAYTKNSKLNRWEDSIEEFDLRFETKSLLAKALPYEVIKVLESFELPSGSFDFKSLRQALIKVQSMNFSKSITPFGDSGVLINGVVRPFKTKPIYEGKHKNLGDILQSGEVPENFFVSDSELEKWKVVKAAKRIRRINPLGQEYWFAEGKMELYDSLSKPSRTIITSEGGNGPSRTRHLIKIGLISRRLTPVELERLNMFPDDFTLVEGCSSSRRAFLMGNALVIGVVEKIRNVIVENYDV